MKREQQQNEPESPPLPSEEKRRGRPGRRSAEDRTAAVLELLSGKVSVHEVGIRFGVKEETVGGWVADARAGILASMRQGSSKSAREVELERELKGLKSAFTTMAIQNELIKNALEQRPFLQRRLQK